jgi:hypothetical protein
MEKLPSGKDCHTEKFATPLIKTLLSSRDYERRLPHDIDELRAELLSDTKCIQGTPCIGEKCEGSAIGP